MPRNDSRRRELADAGLRVLAREGARGLTHRAVDAEAGTPAGTASNYFRTRKALLAALVDRIVERISPDPEVHARLARREPSSALFADYLRDIVARLTAEPDITRAWFELRLEAGRQPDLAEIMGSVLRQGFEGDVAFNSSAGLPGGPFEIALFHYALDGLLFDRLTTPIDPGTSTDAVVDRLVEGLLPGE